VGALKPENDQVTGDRFRHGTKLVRWCTDKAPSECTLAQIEVPAKPAALVADMQKSRIASLDSRDLMA
jgi:hypothetical protein